MQILSDEVSIVLKDDKKVRPGVSIDLLDDGKDVSLPDKRTDRTLSQVN